MIENIGQDFVKDAIAFAIENQKLADQERKSQQRIMDLSSALMDMLVAFDMLTREGGWDTLTEKGKQSLSESREKARMVYLDKEFICPQKMS